MPNDIRFALATLTLFVISLHHLGTARTGAYFSVAPFFGAVLAISLGEPVTVPLLIAGVFMMWGICRRPKKQSFHAATLLEGKEP